MFSYRLLHSVSSCPRSQNYIEASTLRWPSYCFSRHSAMSSILSSTTRHASSRTSQRLISWYSLYKTPLTLLRKGDGDDGGEVDRRSDRRESTLSTEARLVLLGWGEAYWWCCGEDIAVVVELLLQYDIEWESVGWGTILNFLRRVGWWKVLGSALVVDSCLLTFSVVAGCECEHNFLNRMSPSPLPRWLNHGR